MTEVKNKVENGRLKLKLSHRVYFIPSKRKQKKTPLEFGQIAPARPARTFGVQTKHVISARRFERRA